MQFLRMASRSKGTRLDGRLKVMLARAVERLGEVDQTQMSTAELIALAKELNQQHLNIRGVVDQIHQHMKSTPQFF